MCVLGHRRSRTLHSECPPEAWLDALDSAAAGHQRAKRESGGPSVELGGRR